MAKLNEAQAASAYRTALGMLGREPGLNAIGIGYRLRRAFGPAYAAINDQTWRAIGRRAVAARDAAATMNADPSYAPGRSDLATVPGSTLYAERFQYQVLLTITGENGQTVDTVITYRSDTPVSAQQIAADLSARFTPSLTDSPGVKGQLQSIGQLNPPSVVVLAAGRRG